MTKQQLDALFTKLEQDYPNSDTLLSVENMVDWLTKYQRELANAAWAELLPEFPYQGIVRGPRQRSSLGAPSNLPKGLSPTGRKPSQPEIQSFRPSSLPKWECAGASGKTVVATGNGVCGAGGAGGKTVVATGNGVCGAGANGRYGAYNKDRTPAEVYKTTAEQVINQSRSYPSNPVAPATLSRTQIANLMRTEWTHQHDDLITAYVPADNGGGVAAFSVGRVFLDRLSIFRIENAAKAEAAAQDYLFKLVSPDDHTCNWVQKGSKVYCTICEGK